MARVLRLSRHIKTMNGAMQIMKTNLSLTEEVDLAGLLFQPDALLSESYLETVRRKSYLEPEKKLMLAILEDAVACYRRHGVGCKATERALFQETANWIMDEKAESVFSFQVICEVLGVNPEYVRKGLVTDTARCFAYPHPRLSRS